MHNRDSSARRGLCSQSAEAIAAELPLNKHESMCVDVSHRRRETIVVISRWKKTNAGRKRIGQALEFEARHLGGILGLLGNVQHALNSQEPALDELENAANDIALCSIVRPFAGDGSDGDRDCENLRKAETTMSRPQSETPKRKPGGGRRRSLSPEQIEEGVGILRKQPRMTVEAARATLRDAGINGSGSALYRLVIVPAYASGF